MPWLVLSPGGQQSNPELFHMNPELLCRQLPFLKCFDTSRQRVVYKELLLKRKSAHIVLMLNSGKCVKFSKTCCEKFTF